VLRGDLKRDALRYAVPFVGDLHQPPHTVGTGRAATLRQWRSVPFGVGSSPDVIGRLLADRPSAIRGQPVVVQNVPGAAATIGADCIAKAPRDGSTIGLTGDAAMVVRAGMDPPPPYDPIDDLAPMTLLVRTRMQTVLRRSA